MRCYNGCPDSDLQKVLDDNALVRRAIEAAGYSVTYFPSGEFYAGFDANHVPVTGERASLRDVAGELNVKIGEGS